MLALPYSAMEKTAEKQGGRSEDEYGVAAVQCRQLSFELWTIFGLTIAHDRCRLSAAVHWPNQAPRFVTLEGIDVDAIRQSVKIHATQPGKRRPSLRCSAVVCCVHDSSWDNWNSQRALGIVVTARLRYQRVNSCRAQVYSTINHAGVSVSAFVST